MKKRRSFARLCLCVMLLGLLLPTAVSAAKQESGWERIEVRLAQPTNMDEDGWFHFAEAVEDGRFYQECEEERTEDIYGNLSREVTIGVTEHKEIKVTEGYTHTLTWAPPPTFISLEKCPAIDMDFAFDYSGYSSNEPGVDTAGDSFSPQVGVTCKIGLWKRDGESFFTCFEASPETGTIQNQATLRAVLKPENYAYTEKAASKIESWRENSEVSNTLPDPIVLALEVLVERKLSPYDATYEETVFSPVVTYYYALNDENVSALPIAQEVNTDADERTDEVGADVDADIVSGSTAAKVASGVGAILIGGAMAGGISGGGGDTPPDSEEKKKRYRMYFRKSFGDTIRFDAAAQPVYARIVEIDEKGREISRDVLTAQIRFSSKDGSLVVRGAAMSGGYAAAQVSVSSASGADCDTGILSVSFTGEGGSFCNNIAFKLQRSQIVFAQEELILPAKYDKPVRLPFGVGGATAASTVTAVIEPKGVYDVTVEPSEREEVFYAVITEREGLSRAEKNAGEHEDYTLHIKAKLSADDSSELLGSFPVCRFFMGLCVKLDRNYIGCYLEPKEHRKGIERSKLKASDLQPSATQIHTALFTWNEEEHTLLCVPVVPSAFEIVPEDAGDTAAREHIAKMQIECVMEKGALFKDYSFAQGRIACTAGVLDAPLRHKAMLRIRVEHNGKTYTYEDKLALLSQPYREMGADNLALYRREDAKILQNLQRIQQTIDRDGYYQNLFPLYRLIDTMQDAYKVEFGFDAHQYALCRDVFDRFMRGDLMGANAKAEVVTLADEMALFVTATLDKAAEVEDSMGFMSRLALGVVTLGMADATFTGMRVLKEMKDYAESGGESVLEGFYVGAKIVTTEYICDKLMGKAMDMGGKGLKKVAELPAVSKTIDKAKDSVADSVRKLTGFDVTAQAKRGVQRMQQSRSAKASAKAQGQTVLEANRAKPSPDEVKLRKAYQDGLDIGGQKVKDLRASYELMQMNPTPENIELFRKVTRQVQADEYAMYEMMQCKDMPEVCAAFNRQMDVTYQATDRQAREMLARKYQVPVDDVEVFCASSKDKADLLSGKKVTKDRDVTLKVNGEYIPQSEAEQIYQQSLRDNLSGGRVDRDYTNADQYVKTDLRELDAKLDGQAGKRYDQAVVQKTSMENYGSEDDLRRMVNPDYHGEALDDSLRVRSTVKYKGQEWLEQGYAAAEKGDYTTALAKRKEGMRQTLKQFNIADGRNTARYVENGSSKISDALRTQMAVVERCIEDNSISPSAVDSTLAAMGTTFEAVLDQVADLFPAIG